MYEEQIAQKLCECDGWKWEGLNEINSTLFNGVTKEYYRRRAKAVADLLPKGDEEGLLPPKAVCQIICGDLCEAACNGNYCNFINQHYETLKAQKRLDDINKEKEIEGIIGLLKDANKELKLMAEDLVCDHSVGICCCGFFGLIDQIDLVLAKYLGGK